MLSRLSRAALLLAALAAPAAASASEPARPSDPAQPSQRSDPRAERRAPPELICRSVEVAGSDVAPLVCLSAAEWRRAEQ